MMTPVMSSIAVNNLSRSAPLAPSLSFRLYSRSFGGVPEGAQVFDR